MPATEVSDPTAGEWVAAGLAAGLVVVVLAVLLLWPVLRRSSATGWARAAGVLLATVATSLVVIVAIAIAVAVDGDGKAPGPFAGVLVDVDPDTAERIAGYVAALLLPLAAVVAVLALAAVDLGRNTALRVVAGVTAGVVLATGLVIAVGDTGTAPSVAGAAVAALAGAAAFALALDELTAGRSRSQPSSSSSSDSSTMSSQRSLQSRQR